MSTKTNALLGSYPDKVSLVEMWKCNFAIKINAVELIISCTGHMVIYFHCFQTSTALSRLRKPTIRGLQDPASLGSLLTCSSLPGERRGCQTSAGASQRPSTFSSPVRAGWCYVCLLLLLWDLSAGHTAAAEAHWNRGLSHDAGKARSHACILTVAHGLGQCSTPASLSLCYKSIILHQLFTGRDFANTWSSVL